MSAAIRTRRCSSCLYERPPHTPPRPAPLPLRAAPTYSARTELSPAKGRARRWSLWLGSSAGESSGCTLRPTLSVSSCVPLNPTWPESHLAAFPLSRNPTWPDCADLRDRRPRHRPLQAQRNLISAHPSDSLSAAAGPIDPPTPTAASIAVSIFAGFRARSAEFAAQRIA